MKHVLDELSMFGWWGSFAIAFVIVLIIYLSASIFAYIKNCKNRKKILLLNIFLGWSVIGMIAAWIWAIIDRRDEKDTTNSGKPSLYVSLKRK